MPNPVINRRLYSSQALITPPPVSGYAYWFMPDGMVVGATNDYGIVDSSGNISRVKDKGGSTIYAEQLTGANQPSLQTTTVINRSRKVIRFAGSPQTMPVSNAGAVTQNISGLTIYQIAKVTTGGAIIFPFFFSTNVAGGSRTDIRSIAANTWQLTGRRLDADSAYTVAGNSSTSAFKLVTGVIDYANSNGYIYENNSLINSNTSFSTDGNTSNTASALVEMGSIGSGNFFIGDIALILVYVGAHDADQRTAIWNWVNGYF